MGGPGSGWHRGARARCERRIALDLAGSRLAADCLIRTWRDADEYRGALLHVGSAHIAIQYYSCDAGGRLMAPIADERAPLHDVPLRLGGVRRLVGCPGCERRCRILYFGTDRLRYRKCLDLRYASENMQPRHRALAQAVRRIDPDSASIDGLVPKPPRMRWRTYERLGARHARQMDRWAAEIIAKLRGGRDQ